jgi:hypothetical protein
MIVDPIVTHAPMLKEIVLPNVARLLLCGTCKAALQQPLVEN